MNTATTTLNPAAFGAQALTGAHLARQLAAAALLGLVMLYGVAFADSPLAHNAAHDVRHVTVRPCH